MRGWEGLEGRPRPVPLAPTLEEHDHPHPAGDPQGPPSAPHRSRPTDVEGPGLQI